MGTQSNIGGYKGNIMRIDPNKSKNYEILDQIKYHEKMRDWYSGNARGKKAQQKEINRLLKILGNRKCCTS